MAEQRFTAALQDSGRGGGRWLEVPFDPKDVFGESRPAVAGTLNGTPFRGRLSVYGGKAYLGLNREIREAAGIDVGVRQAGVHAPQGVRPLGRGGEEGRDPRAPRREGARDAEGGGDAFLEVEVPRADRLAAQHDREVGARAA